MIRKYLSENRIEFLCAVPVAVFLNVVTDVVFPGSAPVIILTTTSLLTCSKLVNFIKDNVI
jgi:hypothetical protein